MLKKSHLEKIFLPKWEKIPGKALFLRDFPKKWSFLSLLWEIFTSAFSQVGVFQQPLSLYPKIAFCLPATPGDKSPGYFTKPALRAEPPSGDCAGSRSGDAGIQEIFFG